MVISLECSADLHMAQLMPLPLTVSCFSKIQIGFTFLVPAHLGSPRQRAVKRVCVCVCVAAAARTAPRTDGRQRQMDMAPIRLPHGIPGPRNNTDCIIELYKTSNSQKLAYMVQLCKHHHNSEILPTRSAANSSSFSVMPQPTTIWLSASKSQKHKHNSDKLITYSNNNNTNNKQICIAP